MLLAVTTTLALTSCSTEVTYKNGGDDGGGAGGQGGGAGGGPPVVCPPRLSSCGNACVDTQSDPFHCGGCFQSCGPGGICVDGFCWNECPPGLAYCFNQCVDIYSDPLNCGGCGLSCGPNGFCDQGVCLGGPCPPPYMQCGPFCVDPWSDPQHCGFCFNQCQPGEQCGMGTCFGFCPPGLMLCGSQCVNPLFDSGHCGGCFQQCMPGSTCNNGMCQACTNPVCSLCGVQEMGSAVPQTKTGFPQSNQIDPSCAAPGSPEHVYRFTAPSSGSFTFDTFGSFYDTVLHVLDAQMCFPLGCNDDTMFGLESQLTLTLSMGQQVLVIADGYGGDNGQYILNVSQTPTAVCPNANLGSMSPQTVSGDTGMGASVQVGSCGGFGPELSFQFTAPQTGNYIFHTAGSGTDTVLYVRSGGCNGPEIACDDNALGFASLVFVPLTVGQTVIIFVDSWFPGPFTLAILGPI